MQTNTTSDYKGFRFPSEIISRAVWLYIRFSLSFTPLAPAGYRNHLERRVWVIKHFAPLNKNRLRSGFSSGFSGGDGGESNSLEHFFRLPPVLVGGRQQACPVDIDYSPAFVIRHHVSPVLLPGRAPVICLPEHLLPCVTASLWVRLSVCSLLLTSCLSPTAGIARYDGER